MLVPCPKFIFLPMSISLFSTKSKEKFRKNSQILPLAIPVVFLHEKHRMRNFPHPVFCKFIFLCRDALQAIFV